MSNKPIILLDASVIIGMATPISHTRHESRNITFLDILNSFARLGDFRVIVLDSIMWECASIVKGHRLGSIDVIKTRPEGIRMEAEPFMWQRCVLNRFFSGLLNSGFNNGESVSAVRVVESDLHEFRAIIREVRRFEKSEITLDDVVRFSDNLRKRNLGDRTLLRYVDKIQNAKHVFIVSNDGDFDNVGCIPRNDHGVPVSQLSLRSFLGTLLKVKPLSHRLGFSNDISSDAIDMDLRRVVSLIRPDENHIFRRKDCNGLEPAPFKRIIEEIYGSRWPQEDPKGISLTFKPSGNHSIRVRAARNSFNESLGI